MFPLLPAFRKVGLAESWGILTSENGPLAFRILLSSKLHLSAKRNGSILVPLEGVELDPLVGQDQRVGAHGSVVGGRRVRELLSINTPRIHAACFSYESRVVRPYTRIVRAPPR